MSDTPREKSREQVRFLVECAVKGDDADAVVGQIMAEFDWLATEGWPTDEQVEAAAEAIYDYGLPTATHNKRGQRVPFDEAMMTNAFRHAARAALVAALREVSP